jgi:hypothetical protein
MDIFTHYLTTATFNRTDMRWPVIVMDILSEKLGKCWYNYEEQITPSILQAL